jgi:hypothetical protein
LFDVAVALIDDDEHDDKELEKDGEEANVLAFMKELGDRTWIDEEGVLVRASQQTKKRRQ